MLETEKMFQKFLLNNLYERFSKKIYVFFLSQAFDYSAY